MSAVPTVSVSEPFAEIGASNQLDHLLRTTRVQITAMTQMADQKASIMTGLSVVMLSIIFGYVQTNEATISLAVFGLAVLAAAMTAVLAVMPTRKKAGVKTTFNPLFFGHIASVREEEYLGKMASILRSEGAVYEMLVRDIYQLSTVVTRKYRLVSLSYTILLCGLALAGVSLAVELGLRI